jgi:hypothetical protein
LNERLEMLTALYVILGISALVLAVLLIRISVQIKVKDELKISICWLFLSFKVYPAKEKSKSGKLKSGHTKKENPIKVYTKELIKDKGIDGAIKEIISLCKDILKPFRPFLKKSVVKIKRLHVLISCGDAATTAIVFGAVNSLLYSFIGYIQDNLKLNKKNVSVNTDFSGTKSLLDADIYFSVRPISVIGLIFDLVKVYL